MNDASPVEIFVSLAAFRHASLILAVVRNVLSYTEPKRLALHISRGSSRSEQLLRRLRQQPRLVLNPNSFAVETHGPELLGVHLSNVALLDQLVGAAQAGIASCCCPVAPCSSAPARRCCCGRRYRLRPASSPTSACFQRRLTQPTRRARGAASQNCTSASVKTLPRLFEGQPGHEQLPTHGDARPSRPAVDAPDRRRRLRGTFSSPRAR